MPPNNPSLRRKAGSLTPGRRILIVCEGAKTEPNYFAAVKKNLRSSTLAIEICGEECGSDPVSVVGFAKQRRAEAKRGAKKSLEAAFDEVWCVIDVDQHPNLNQAIGEALGAGLRVALSNPCFEYWLLLHHRNTNRGYENCDAVIRDLRDYLPDYKKGQADMAGFLPLLSEAVIRSVGFERRRLPGETVRQSNSSSDVHKLIQMIQMNSVKPYVAATPP